MRETTKKIVKKIFAFFRGVRQILFFLVFTVVAFLAYLHFHGLPLSWKQKFLSELAHRGIMIELKSLHFEPLRGLVARGIEYKTVQDSTIKVAELSVNFHFTDLLFNNFTFDHLVVEGADIQLHSPGETSPIVMQRASGTFRFLGNKIVKLESIQGDLLGLRLEINGQLDTTPAEKKEGAEKKPSKIDLKKIQSYLAKIGAVQKGEPILISIDVDGKLADSKNIVSTARVYGKSVSYEGWKADVISGKITYIDGVVVLPSLSIESNGGKCSIFGWWDIPHGYFEVETVSNLDPNALFLEGAKYRPTFLKETRFNTPPEFWIKASMNMNDEKPFETLEANANFLVRNTSWRGNLIQECRGTIYVSKGQVEAPHLVLVKDLGKMNGDFAFDIPQKKLFFDFDSSIDVAWVMKLLYPSEKNWFQLVQFTRPCPTKLAGEWAIRDPNGLKAKGEFDWRDWYSNQVFLRSAKAKIDIDGRKFHFTNAKLLRDEGEVTGNFTLDFGSQTHTIDARSSISFLELTRLIGPYTEKLFSYYKFLTPPKLTLKGTLNTENPSENDFFVHVESDRFKIWKLSASNVSADIRSQGKCLEIANLKSTFYDGRLEGNAVFDLSTPQQDWTFNCHADQVDFDRFTNDLWQYQQVEGRLTGWAEVSGTMLSSKECVGRGEATIADGLLWKIPLFGELSKFIPILGEHNATKGMAAFTIADEKVNVDDMKVSAGILSLTAKGIYKFDESVDFIVQGHFLRAFLGLGYVLDPFTKAFEYHLGGKLSDRKWKPRFIPKELLLQFGDGSESKSQEEKQDRNRPR